MSQELIAKATAGSMKQQVPEFRVGDTVRVLYRIIEGDKERLQPFIGTVIARKGSDVRETFTVRRIVNNEGVERVFPIHSPRLAEVQVVRSGKTRRAKLYYLRKRIGKATRLKEIRRRPTAARPGAGTAPAQGAEAPPEGSLVEEVRTDEAQEPAKE